MFTLLVVLLLPLFLSSNNAQIPNIEVPEARVEVFYPFGLKVSIPDLDVKFYPNIGIKLFAFHGNINVRMNGRECGYFCRDILEARNGRWTFFDEKARINIGDIIYYWTHMIYNDGKHELGYNRDHQSYTVKYYNNINSTTTSTTPMVSSESSSAMIITSTENILSTTKPPANFSSANFLAKNSIICNFTIIYFFIVLFR